MLNFDLIEESFIDVHWNAVEMSLVIIYKEVLEIMMLYSCLLLVWYHKVLVIEDTGRIFLLGWAN